MGDKGGKKDKEKNKATAVDETERRRAEEARQSAGQEALGRLEAYDRIRSCCGRRLSIAESIFKYVYRRLAACEPTLASNPGMRGKNLSAFGEHSSSPESLRPCTLARPNMGNNLLWAQHTYSRSGDPLAEAFAGAAISCGGSHSATEGG